MKINIVKYNLSLVIYIKKNLKINKIILNFFYSLIIFFMKCFLNFYCIIIREEHTLPLRAIGHIHFTLIILKRSKSTILLTFSTIVNRNSTHLIKFIISYYKLYFSLGTKVHMTQSSRDIIYLFFVNNKRKFNRRIKVYI